MFLTEEAVERKDLAWIVNGHEGYGVQQAILSLSQSLNQLGWRTPLFALDDGPFVEKCQKLGLNVICLRAGFVPGFGHRSIRKNIVAFWHLLKFERKALKLLIPAIRQSKVGAIQFLWPNLLSIAGKVAQSLQVPCFWHMPNVVSQRYPLAFNKLAYHVKCKQLNVQPLADSTYTAFTLGNFLVKPQVFYHAADAQRFNPEKVSIASVGRQDLQIPENAIVLGVFARLNPMKGQDRILKAILALKEYQPPLHLLLLGGPLDSTFVKDLKLLAEKEKASDRLHFVGLVTDPENYYQVVDVAVNSCLDPEPFGLSVVEAMLMAKPVLVHALGGPAETVLDGVTGWHVSDPTIESFVAGVQRMLGERPQWCEMGQKGRERALKNYTNKILAQKYIKIVEQASRSYQIK